MNRSVSTVLSGIFMATVLATGPPSPAAAEEATIKAFSVWQDQGDVIQTKPNEAILIGAIF